MSTPLTESKSFYVNRKSLCKSLMVHPPVDMSNPRGEFSLKVLIYKLFCFLNSFV